MTAGMAGPSGLDSPYSDRSLPGAAWEQEILLLKLEFGNVIQSAPQNLAEELHRGVQKHLQRVSSLSRGVTPEEAHLRASGKEIGGPLAVPAEVH